MNPTINTLLSCGVMVALVNGAIELIKYLIHRYDKKRGKMDSQTVAIRFCLLGEFERYCQYLIERGTHPSADEFHKVQEMYDAYKGCGGDGYADAKFSAVCELYKSRI